MTVLSLVDAVVLLGRFPALSGASLHVAAGESVLLQGPNGAGKSTLLRLCAGLLPLESGSAEVLGHNLVDDRQRVRPKVGFVGHRTMLYDDLTVAENLRFWGRLAKVDDALTDAAARRLRIDDRLHGVLVRQLSAGQRRRVALAVAAARQPQLWLLDEPHAGLDQAGRDIVDDVVRDATEAGACVLIASHELDRVRPIVQRQVTVAGGLVREEVADAA
ncbi:MAG: heme ABC exporter ATP-binding protein CcmA [Acidimicrobiales bacterium]|nr:heme ABC exporter ATP-binding protein CcmA [Acidimicrobiales bacterium]